MKNYLLLVLLSGSWFSVFSQNALEVLEKSAFSIGETVQIKSAILKEERTLNIYLPNGYSPDSARQYPVIYLLDGSRDEDFIHIAGLVQFGSFFWINMIPETIVVGIGNIDRERDFTYPTSNKQDQVDFPTTGGSEQFIKFIEQELQPFVESHYQTNDTTTIIGQSLGGLLATEILFKKPTLFDNYIIVSPSLWWDDESLLKATPQALSEPKSIYVGVGKEGEVMERVAKELYDKLRQSYSEDTRLFYQFLDKRDHGDALHEAVYNSFEYLFQQEK